MQELKDSFWDYSSLIIFNVLAMIVGFGTMMLMTRSLGVAGFGTFNMMLLIVNLAYTFSVNWTNAALLRFGKEDHVRTGKLNAVFWSRTAVAAPMVVLAFIILAIFKNTITNYVGISTKVFLMIPALILVLGISDYVKFLFQAMRGLRQYALVIFLEKVFVFVLIGAAWFLAPGNRLPAITAAYGVGFLIASLIMAMRFPGRALVPVRVEPEMVKKIINFSYFILIGSIGVYVTNWIDLMVIDRYMTRADVGVYSLAYRVMTTLQQFSMLAIPLTLPMIIALRAQGNTDTIKRYLMRFVPQGIFFWSIILSLGLIACRPLLPLFFGKSYTPSLIPLYLLFIALGMNLLACFHSCMITSYELIRPYYIVTIIAGILNLVLDFILVPRIGISGAAVATLCVFSVTGITSQVLANRVHGTFTWRQIAPMLTVAAVAAAALLVKGPAFYPLSLIVLAGCSIILLKTARLFEPGDEEFLNRITMPAGARRAAAAVYKTLMRLS